jgi:DUF1680 family protein
LQLDGDSRYADVMERALYNGVLSGVSLDGERFFYANPLEVNPAVHAGRPDLYGRTSVTPERQEWFGCACCPPNIARLLASLGGYAYSVREDDQPGVYVHLFIEGEAIANLDGSEVRLRQQTRYPWEGTIHMQVGVERPTAFSLWLRVPNWCRQATIRVNGEPVDVESSLELGYARLQRNWRTGDQVELTLSMPVERVEAHPAVAHDCGRVALQRGPLVYCLEQIDHDVSLHDLMLPRKAPLEAVYEPDLLGGVVVIRGEGLRRDPDVWGGSLYRHDRSDLVPTPIMAVPYYAWANRGLGQMLVWIREAEPLRVCPRGLHSFTRRPIESRKDARCNVPTNPSCSLPV